VFVNRIRAMQRMEVPAYLLAGRQRGIASMPWHPWRD
jgi:hypothetical protein